MTLSSLKYDIIITKIMSSLYDIMNDYNVKTSRDSDVVFADSIPAVFFGVYSNH